MTLRQFRADLHVHTVLSPCAEVEMIPPLIVETAVELGIDLIAITDHNSTANIRAVQKAARKTSLTVLPGMELQTKEDIHSLCLFDTIDQAEDFQKLVNPTLPSIKNNDDLFGAQFIVDETGNYIRNEDRLLITSSSLSLNVAFSLVSNMGGLFIPAHINRKTFGLIDSLGFLPPEIAFEAVEISRHITPQQARVDIPSIKDLPVIQNGDVHRLDEFLGSLYLEIEKPNISEIRMALQGHLGRSFKIDLN
jgi:PHP family Zn ribbon phosphoesterase